MDKKKEFLKKNYWMLFPIVHIIASFIYENSFFGWDANLGVMSSVALRESVSNTFEFVMTYVISKIIAAVLIYMLWKLIFGIILKKIPVRVSVLFGVIFAGLLVICLVEWPQSIIGGGGSDHLITYLYAKNFVPYYWHSIYTSCLYAGCLMVAPTPFALPVIQCLSAVAVLGYVYVLLEDYTKKLGCLRWLKYLTFAAVLSPHFIDLITNTWRSCLFAILSVLFFAMIIRTVLLEHDKKISTLVIIMLIGAVLSVWRSEGIFYGVLGFMAMLIWGYRYRFKQVLLWTLAFLAVFFVLGRPSSVGEKKYYGNDYLKVCFVTPLASVFNDSNANLSYKGAQEDIAAIEAVVPKSVLQQRSYYGYISNNYAKGFEDVDQTGATDEESGAFIKATIRILLHNPGTYIKTQLNMWFAAFDFHKSFYIEPYHGNIDKMEPFPLTMWNKGEAVLKSEAGVSGWISSPAKNSAMTTVNTIMYKYTHLWKGFGRFDFTFLGHLLLVIMDAVIVLTEVVNIFRKKRENMFFGWVALIMLGVLAITIMMMPTPFVTYFYAFIYCSFMLGVFYAAVKLGKKKKDKK